MLNTKYKPYDVEVFFVCKLLFHQKSQRMLNMHQVVEV